jgi:hypothetical protein
VSDVAWPGRDGKAPLPDAAEVGGRR